MIEKNGYMCERGRDCKWKCFAFDSNGFTFGDIPDDSTAWKKWHDKECGGKLIPLKITEKG